MDKKMLFENLNIENLAKCTEWPQNELKEPDMNSTLYMHLLGTRGINCPAFRSTISRFQEIEDFRIFPLIPILKFQSAKTFVKKK